MGHLEVVKFLLEQGADIHAESNKALRFAAIEGCLDVVKYLVEQGADIHAQNEGALQTAAQRGHIEVVKCLVEQGAPIDVAERDGTDAVKDFCKAYKLQQMLGAKLQASIPTKPKSARLKI
ncbi:Ankyrin repeat protein [compost metagenome]